MVTHVPCLPRCESCDSHVQDLIAVRAMTKMLKNPVLTLYHCTTHYNILLHTSGA